MTTPIGTGRISRPDTAALPSSRRRRLTLGKCCSRIVPFSIKLPIVLGGIMPQSGEPFERIHAQRGRELFDAKELVWIDVREPAEWQQTRIPGATLVPLNTLLLNPRQYLSRDGVVFYCAQGIRSAVACEVAAAIGLHCSYNLEGGIQEWAAEGCPVES